MTLMSTVTDLSAWRAARQKREAEAEMEAMLRKFVEDDEPKIDCRVFVPTYEVVSRHS